ncbi:MAG: hypothetical protein J2P46_01950 [Zavarzinella sp.]|nr:hypothetical protein [Zavarzinella sp.]
MRSTTIPGPRRIREEPTQSKLLDYYAEERLAKARIEARQARARNALRLAGLLIGAAGLAGALRAWDAGLQP